MRRYFLCMRVALPRYILLEGGVTMRLRLLLTPLVAMTTALLSVSFFPSYIGWWQWLSVSYVTSLGCLIVTFLLLARIISKNLGWLLHLPLPLRDRRRWLHIIPLLLAGGTLFYLGLHLPGHSLGGTVIFGGREWMMWRKKNQAIL